MKVDTDFSRPDVVGNAGKSNRQRTRVGQVVPFANYRAIPGRPGWFDDYCGHLKYDPEQDPEEMRRREAVESAALDRMVKELKTP